jgi:hypothetical protein
LFVARILLLLARLSQPEPGFPQALRLKRLYTVFFQRHGTDGDSARQRSSRTDQSAP